MDEQPVVEQENDVGDRNNRSKEPASVEGDKSSAASSEEFDPDQFAALMQKELIAYNFSWDPLLKALQALGLSMARQQRAQKSSNDSVEDMHDQVGSLRDQLSQVQSEKDAMGSALADLRAQMDKMQAQVEQLQEQQQEQAHGDNGSDQSNNGASSSLMPLSNEDQSASDSKDPFVTAKDLVKVKRDMSKELRRSLSEAFGDEDVEGDDSGNGSSNDATAGSNSNADSAATPRTSFKRPGAPFASDAVVKQEISRLEKLQDALNDKIAARDQQLAALLGKVEELDTKASDLATHLASDSAVAATSESHNETPRLSDESSAGANTEALLKELDELKAAQATQNQQLKDQHQTLGKHASDIKTLVQSLDDLAVQQQTTASMFASMPAAGSTSASDEAQGEKRRSSNVGPPQLDLSLVFTKIADLRRTTDASLDLLQNNINSISTVSDSQQAQLDALRTGLVFNEHQRLHMIEARLAMQKELLDRNQTQQDRTKPQLAEWRKALELNEEKLTQGLCDEEILQELQQLQRNYRRAYLSFSPLINSPLTIAESLQVLAEEVKQFQNGVKAGAVPLRTTNDGSAPPKRNEREEEFTKKLRFLDEEVNATLQVNVVTEKKNDPLIKSLDAMREKLESLSTMWYRNYTQRKRASRGPSDGQGSIADLDCTPRSASSDYDGLREVELRLMGAVRRLGLVEEDVERLNSMSAISASEMDSAARAAAMAAASGGGSVASARVDRDEIEKLRKELFAEVAKMTAMLANLQATSHLGGSTSIVPVTSSSAQQLASSRSTNPSQNDLVKELYSQMKGREVDGRFQELRDDEVQKQLYDNFLKDVTKKVTHAVLNADKSGAGVGGRLGGPHASGAGGVAANNVNYRLMLENFTQKVEDRLEDAREMTAEDLLRMKKELADQLKLKIDLALRELRAELMLLPADTGDSTAMGTKPVMCVACSRPVPVSHMVREAGSLPPVELQGEHSPPHNHGAAFPPDFDYERTDDEFVYRAGFRMPANDRKTMTLPFLSANMRSKMMLNKPEGRRKRPVRQSHNVSRVDTVIREAMELDRSSRLRTHEPHPQSQ